LDPETRLGETAEGVRMVATLATAHPSTVTTTVPEPGEPRLTAALAGFLSAQRPPLD